MADFHADWKEHGRGATAEVRKKRPQDYLRIAVSMCPRQLEVEQNDIDALADDEVLEALAVVRERMAQRKDAKVIDARPVDGNSGPSEARACVIPDRPARNSPK